MLTAAWSTFSCWVTGAGDATIVFAGICCCVELDFGKGLPAWRERGAGGAAALFIGTYCCVELDFGKELPTWRASEVNFVRLGTFRKSILNVRVLLLTPFTSADTDESHPPTGNSAGISLKCVAMRSCCTFDLARSRMRRFWLLLMLLDLYLFLGCDLNPLESVNPWLTITGARSTPLIFVGILS